MKTPRKLLVRKGGLEPPRFYPPDPKSGASANSATFARLKRRQRFHCSVRPAALALDFVPSGCIQSNTGDEMARKSKTPESKVSTTSDELKGWQQIAAFLGEPTSVVQRWASEGMPVRRQGRFVSTTPQELNDWMGKESGKPVHVATGNVDLTSELKRAVSFARREK
jgi:hypothetical protein